MLTAEKEKEYESLVGDEEGRAFLAQLLDRAKTTVKAADDRGVIYKEAPPWAQALIGEVRELGTRVKAVETKAPMPPEEMIAAGETELTDGDALLDTDLPATAADAAAEELLDDDSFADLVADKVLAKLMPQLDLETKMAKWAGEIKSSIPAAVAQKDDARGAEIATLKARIEELEGGQPRSFRSQVWRDIVGQPQIVTKEQAAQLTAKDVPAEQAAQLAGLETQAEKDAYKLIYGDA